MNDLRYGITLAWRLLFYLRVLNTRIILAAFWIFLLRISLSFCRSSQVFLLFSICFLAVPRSFSNWPITPFSFSFSCSKLPHWFSECVSFLTHCSCIFPTLDTSLCSLVTSSPCICVKLVTKCIINTVYVHKHHIEYHDPTQAGGIIPKRGIFQVLICFCTKCIKWTRWKGHVQPSVHIFHFSNHLTDFVLGICSKHCKDSFSLFCIVPL